MRKIAEEMFLDRRTVKRYLELNGKMKFGPRKPSLKGRISARISPKRQIVHRAGLKMPKEYGWVRDPKKYVYNKVYNKTSFDIFKVLKKLFK